MELSNPTSKQVLWTKPVSGEPEMEVTIRGTRLCVTSDLWVPLLQKSVSTHLIQESWSREISDLEDKRGLGRHDNSFLSQEE